MRLLPFRRKRPEPTIGEAEAYARSYGEKSADVKPVTLGTMRPSQSIPVTLTPRRIASGPKDVA